MRAILDKALWGTLLFLFGPSVMVVASWNTLPGDYLYGTKLALERTALAIVSPSYATVGNLQIKYTQRRYAEAKQLLASKQSVTGLPYLQQQITQTQHAIRRAPDKTTQVALAKQYINTLATVSNDLETQKQSLTSRPKPIAYVPPDSNTSSVVVPPVKPQSATSPSPRINPTSAPIAARPAVATPTPLPTQIAQVTTTTPIPTQDAIAALQIDQTQQNVKQTIADLRTLVDEDNHARDEGRGKNKNNDQKGNNQDHRQNQDGDGDRGGGSKKNNE